MIKEELTDFYSDDLVFHWNGWTATCSSLVDEGWTIAFKRAIYPNERDKLYLRHKVTGMVARIIWENVATNIRADDRIHLDLEFLVHDRARRNKVKINIIEEVYSEPTEEDLDKLFKMILEVQAKRTRVKPKAKITKDNVIELIKGVA